MHKKDLLKSRKPKRQDKEFEEQCVVIAWAQMSASEYPELKWLHASLNGVKLTMRQAIKAKKSGMKKGIADLFLPAKNRNFSGIYIEMKAGKNKQSAEQVEFQKFVVSQNYQYCLCYSANDAIQEIKKYINCK